MPRYRFAWTNLPVALRNGLVRDLGLDTVDPAEALKAEYGARPGERFVQDAWDCLRDRWLAHDADALEAVIQGLWERKRDGYRPLSGVKEQVAWLRQRNNTPRLREVVVEQFIAAGERQSGTAVLGTPKDHHLAPLATSVTEHRTGSSLPTPRPGMAGGLAKPEHAVSKAEGAPRGPGRATEAGAPGRGEGLGSVGRPASGGSRVITGNIKSQVDKVWDAFWSGGISNPLEVIEQITYLLFLRRLDDMQILEENKATRLKQPVAHAVFPEGKDDLGLSYQDMRWSHFRHLSAGEMFTVVDRHVFPFLRTLGGDGTTYAHHMRDARFTIPTPQLLAKVVDLIADVPMDDRDTKGDLYEYMLSKIATAGQNGQFRTPRHIIQLMVEMVAPTPTDVICDPACGTAGFLIAAGEYLRHHYPEMLRDEKPRAHFHHEMFHGFDFDNTMLRIGSMNMLLHGVENPDIMYRDSLSQGHAGEEERYSLVLANPPFAGSLDYENTAKDLQAVVKTKKTELLFLALFIRLLRPGGRAAVIVPDGVLFGSSNAHKTLRKILVEDQKLDGVVSLPSGVFKPYAGVSTAILLFTKTNSGGTDQVWFYDVDADGWSLDDKRTPLLSEDKLGPVPAALLTAEDHVKNNLPDTFARWANRNGSELDRSRTDRSFCVAKADIVAQEYDLSLNRYKEVVHANTEYRPPLEILADLARIERDIQQGMKDLEAMLQ